MLHDTGFPKDGEDSPGVKRQYSGTLGTRGNCQIGVSVHAVGARPTVPLGWGCICRRTGARTSSRAREAKIPSRSCSRPSPELGVELVERAADWYVPKAPVLGDHAYGENTWLRERLDRAGCEYVLSVGLTTKVFAQGTSFAVPPRTSKDGRAPFGHDQTARPNRSGRADRPARGARRTTGHLPRRP